MKAGCLLVLNDQGHVVTTFSGHGINGPWDMTAVNFGGSHHFLNGPLGLAIAPPPYNVILSVNGGDGYIVGTSINGGHHAGRLLDSTGSPPGAGALFGLAVAPQGKGIYFVNDNTNTLNLLQ